MGTQKYSDEGNWKHEPKTEHPIDDSFGEGNRTRNWQKDPAKKVLDRSEGKKFNPRETEERNEPAGGAQ